MIDYPALMAIFSLPRPNGSAAERETRRAIQDWLGRRGIRHRLQSFRIYPYFFEATGIWLIASRTLLAVAIWLRWGWPALPIALLGLPGGLLDVALGFPLVTWPGARRGYNILIEFEPANASQELILSAHYDSKTELLDHRQRMFFLKNLRLGILLTLLLGLLGPLDRLLLEQGSTWARYTYPAGIVLSLLLLSLAWGLGLNLSLGRFMPPSQGAVDNGAACAILLGLAGDLANHEPISQRTRVTLALFTGEEANMQGSRAYLRQRDPSLPAAAVNLEVMAQDGDYVFWEQDGSVFKLAPTSPELNAALVEVVHEVTGEPPRPAGPITSDGASFLRAGIPASVLGTCDRNLGVGGFHRPSDCLDRVVLPRIPEGVEILTRLIGKYDREGLKILMGDKTTWISTTR